MSITQPGCVCICSHKYPACNAHVPYCHLWPVPLYSIFHTLSHKRHDFRTKKLLITKCVYQFTLQLLSETFLILGRNERGMTKNVFWSSRKLPFIFVRFKRNLIFSRQFFFREKKHSNVKFHKNPSSGNRVVPCGQT